jgi:polyisoprenyl-phosphate glycosyltransferase
MKLISLVIPVYNEEQGLNLLFERLDSFLKTLGAFCASEVILVDDHSSDNTLDILKKRCADSSQYKYLRLSKNSGSHIAIIAGLSQCKGDCAVFLAADLQDPPELISELLSKHNEGYNVVWAVRKNIEGISRKTSFFSKLFYRVMNSISTVSLPPSGADFALIDRKVINALVQSAGSNPSLGSLIAWIGFKQAEILYVKESRKFGKSKWTLTKKLNAFADALVGFSYAPMRIMTYIGFASSIFGFLYALLVIYLKVSIGKQIDGWSSLMVVLLVIGGLLMLMLGILGEYLWRSLEEARKRPLFFIEDSNDTENR